MKKSFSNRGFTLIEILVVMGIIAILAAIVIIAVNPDRQFKQANNTQRYNDVNAILNAIGQNIADNKGTFNCGATLPTGTATTSMIGTGGTNIESCIVPTYLPAMPLDPLGGASANTKYFVAKYPSGRFVVIAPSAELGQTIEVTR